MLMNFIAFVVCAVAAIYQGVNGNLGSCLLDIALALINLPYAIKWLKEFFADWIAILSKGEYMEENIRDLENQRHELDKKIKQYYEKEEMCRIRHNEEKYVGKCYKIDDGESTVYIKILSGLTNNTYCYMHCMEFKLPINPEFKQVSRMNLNKKFEYGFMGDLLDFDDICIKPLPVYKKIINKRVEITIKEFEDALKEFGEQLLKLSREDFTLNGKYFIG